mmetsp:Transcript_20026/g.51306  ORF Transcript_20026/g.51306 Transcript_20026/m.51306 type:complete len:428 (+) Transcript_20026:375-1658(+)
MQAGARHRHAANGDGLQHGDGRQPTGPAERHLDGQQARDSLLRRELPGDGPARIRSHTAERLLHVEAVHLEHRAVRLVRQRSPPRHPRPRRRDRILEAVRQPVVAADGEARAGEALQVLPVRGTQRCEGAAARQGGEQLVRHKAEAPFPGRHGVQQAQRAGGGVARVGEGLLPGGHLRPVHLRVRLLCHVHLATHLKVRGQATIAAAGRRHACQHSGDLQRVVCHVLPLRAVPARGSLLQGAAAVGEPHSKAVHLGLHHPARRAQARQRAALRALLAPRAAALSGRQVVAHPRQPHPQLLRALYRRQAEHALPVPRLAERLKHGRAHGARSRCLRGVALILPSQLPLQRLHLPLQRIVHVVADQRLALCEVRAPVRFQVPLQRLQPLRGRDVPTRLPARRAATAPGRTQRCLGHACRHTTGARAIDT